ncbi:hypothetical protein, conserved [Angomonas deanei]|uniref:Histidine phosphatase superfamily (Branch 1) n=1 Tax=Angomonas deanei TaxID=59799 RepID=A0A7G2C855_9TRYP|nr:hypothetical protein, conserved [Angomonas deanei]
MRPYVCTHKIKYYLSLQYSPSSPLWTGTTVRHTSNNNSNNNSETVDSNQNNNISNNDSSQPPKKAKRMSITIRSGSARAKAKEERKKNTKTKPENGMEKTTDYFINHHKHTNPPMQVTLGNAMEEDPDWDTLRPTAASINLLHYNNHNQQNIMEQVSPTPSQRLDGVNEMRTRRTSRTRFVEPVKRIILIRNGHSAANDNLNTYVTTPDWRIPLVREGVQQCLKAGREVADIVGAEPVYFYYSPYIRSRQSLRYVLEGYDEGRRSNVSQPWWSSEDPSENNNNDNENQNNTVSLPQNAAPEVEPPHPTTTSNTVNDLLFLRQDSSDIIGVREDVRLRDGDIGRYSSLEECYFTSTNAKSMANFSIVFHSAKVAPTCATG